MFGDVLVCESIVNYFTELTADFAKINTPIRMLLSVIHRRSRREMAINFCEKHLFCRNITGVNYTYIVIHKCHLCWFCIFV